MLWLLVLTLTFMFLPLYLVSATLREANRPLEAQLSQIQSTLASTPQPGAVERDLSASLTQAMGDIQALQPVYDG